MKNLKMPTSDSYREFLIECLKYPEHAAGYIEPTFRTLNCHMGSNYPEAIVSLSKFDFLVKYKNLMTRSALENNSILHRLPQIPKNTGRTPKSPPHA